MNRCTPCFTPRAIFFLLWRRSARCIAQLLALVTLLMVVSPTLQAQTLANPITPLPLSTHRPIPDKAQRAVLQVLQPPVILLNGQQERLSPGARIRNKNNMLVLSGALIGKNLPVAFVREPLGLVHEIWILNEAELQRSTAQP